MEIICVKVKNIRPKYDNLKEWMEDENNVYIGRRGIVFVNDKLTGKKVRFPPKDSIFANPFKIGKDGDRKEVIEKYKKYIIDRLSKDENLVKELKKLKGKTLGCWCRPETCHGDVLIELINL